MSAPGLDPQHSLPIPLWKKLAGIWSLVAAFIAVVWLWPDSSPSKTAGPDGLRPASCEAIVSGSRLLTTPIEQIRVFDWVVAENPYGSSPDEPVDAVDWPDWRVLSLRILKPDGSAAEIELARPPAWVELQEATLGGPIWLDLAEMGISGWAEVGSIGKCPDPGPRPSPRHSLVTATFKHTSDQVVRLQVSGEAQALGVTASHPIWSVDRGEFVEVGALDQGERVLALDGGEHLVAALLPRPGPTAVYNLEVFGAHVYHVGASGLLAHNMCAAERAAGRALVPKVPATLGQWGEMRLAYDLGYQGAKPSSPFRTTLGKRYFDRLVDRIAHEAKAGVNVGLTSAIRTQALKDAELIAIGRIKGAHWHFYQGAQKELRDFLTACGIAYTLH